MTYRINDRQLPKDIQVPGYVRRVDEHCEDLTGLHTRFARQTHGCLFRNELSWEEYWRWDEDDTTVAIYYTAERQPAGYMVYRIDQDIFYIKEMIHLNLEARNGLMRYIAAHDSMIDEVRGDNYHGKPIAFSLGDSEIKETIRPYIMGRIVDFEAFIQDYQFEADADGPVIEFDIRDPFLEWNNRVFVLAVGRGRGRLVKGPAGHKVSLGIGTLTTLLLGYIRASELAELEHLKADDETIRIIDNIVIDRKPYLSDYI